MKHRLTAHQFAETFADAKLNLFGVIEHLSEVEVLKKGRDTARPAADIVPGGEVYKWQQCYFQALSNYETAVINAQKREGAAAPAFEVKAHPWAVPFGDSKIIRTHKDYPARPGYYLQVRCPKSLPVSVEFRDRQGNVLEASAIMEILPSKEQPATKAARREHEATRQGVTVENVVVIRDYGVANIVKLAYCGDTYEIVSEELAAAEATLPEAVATARLARQQAEEAEESRRNAEAAAATAEQVARRHEERAEAARAAYEAASAPRPGMVSAPVPPPATVRVEAVTEAETVPANA